MIFRMRGAQQGALPQSRAGHFLADLARPFVCVPIAAIPVKRSITW